MPRRQAPGIIRFRGQPDESLVDEALSALSRGGVAALPTDTVYGLAVRADLGDAIKRVYRIKGRGFDKPLVLLARDAESAGRLCRDLPSGFDRLAQKFWPGPLTLVLGASRQVTDWGLGGNGTVGVRVSAEAVVRMILERIGVPLASTSANRSGQPECHSGAEVLRSLKEPPDLLLDGGERPRRRPSTVLDLSGPRPVLLRRGAIGRAELEEACGRPVGLARIRALFVCTGNTCRSPMAEGLLRARLPKHWRGLVEAESCGTGALPGMPATATAQQAARKRGFDISGHRSQPLTRDLVEEADLVVAMEDRHRRAVLDLAPGADVMLLDEGGVPDPIGGSLDDYLETLDLQGSNLPEVVRRIGGMLSESEQRKGKRK